MKKFYGKTSADLIINTAHGDIIINIDIKFALHLMANDKITLVYNPFWLKYIQIFATKEKNNKALIDMFKNYTITVIDRYFDGDGVCVFGKLSEFDMKELNTFLNANPKVPVVNSCNHILPDGRSAMILCGSDNDMTYICSICNEKFI